MNEKIKELIAGFIKSNMHLTATESKEMELYLKQAYDIGRIEGLDIAKRTINNGK